MSLMKVKGTSLHSSLTQHLLQGDAHSFRRQGWETFRESLNGLPHWKHHQRWLMTILGGTESCRKVVTDVHWVFFLIVHEIHSLHLFWCWEDKHWPRPWGSWGRGPASSLWWAPSQLKQHHGGKFVKRGTHICCIKYAFALVFVSIILKSTDDINTINCQHDLWWHLKQGRTLSLLTESELSRVVNKCW